MPFRINNLAILLALTVASSMAKLELGRNSFKGNSESNTLEEVMVDHVADDNDKTVAVTIEMGTPPKNYSLLIDIRSDLTWLPDDSTEHAFPYKNPFVSAASSSYANLSDPFELNNDYAEVLGFTASDIISIKGKSAKINWGYALTSGAFIKFDGGISLKYQYLSQFDKQFSIMAMLLESKAISKNVFSLYLRHAAPGTSRLYLGNLHEDFNSKNLSGTCDLNQTDRDWSCQMTHVVIGVVSSKTFKSVAYEQSETFQFTSTGNYILLPLKYAEYFKKKLPHLNYICNSACYFTVKTRWDNPPIYFVFNKTAYRIDPSALYTDKGYYFVMNIYFSDDFTPSLGSPFLNSVHIAFDADNNKVHLAVRNSLSIVNLLSENPVEANRYNLNVIIGASCGGLALFSIILLTICCCMRKKRRQNLSITSIEEKQFFDL